jgi:hypothetical protein
MTFTLCKVQEARAVNAAACDAAIEAGAESHFTGHLPSVEFSSAA